MGARLKRFYFRFPAAVRKPVILVIGGTVLLIGIAMIVLPGPAILVVPLGLIILAVEFVWAKKLLDKVRERTDRLRQQYRKKR